ncbi:MAG TPA: tyrosine--tRNA ligase [Hymenobacter sp.]
MDFIPELTWRGMFHDAMPGTAEHLAAHAPITGYIGFDPTAASLHIGNLATIMLLVHLQRAGHRPVALVGGATGMIGDPSGKSAERNLLDETTLRHNQAGIKAQLEKFLDFSDSPTGALVVNNYDWFKDFGFLGFLREVGKHLTVNYMMAKDSVKRRISGNEDSGADGLSYTEFSYQLLQGYDFVHLNKTLGCTLQMGASDQWGNITTGTELIRRIANADGTEAKAYALTGQLITKADGTKYGKSETGTVWLDPALTSPYQFYQFFLNAADADAPRLIRVFTLLTQPEIEQLEAVHAENPGLNTLQKALAKDVTIRVHSEAAYEAAAAASQVLFGGGDLLALDESTLLAVFAGTPRLQVPRAEAADLNVSVLLSEATDKQILPSRGEVRKLVQANGISINREKVASPDAPVAGLALLHDKYLVVQKGKRNYYLIELV